MEVMHSNIVNDNGFFKTPLIIDNDNVNKYELAQKVEGIAYALVDKFGAPNNFEYYCKIAYKLSESRIWLNFERAKKGNSPAKLFTYLCNKDMRQNH